jgi:hypothetical protein
MLLVLVISQIVFTGVQQIPKEFIMHGGYSFLEDVKSELI